MAARGSVGGVDAIVKYYAGKHNPTGTGDAARFDGTPIGTTFFDTAIYMVDAPRAVSGGGRGEDQGGRNRTAWKAGLSAGYEIADHTVHHFNGGVATIDPASRPRNFTAGQWQSEIASCRTILTASRYGLGARRLIGFRAPYLSINDNLFTALRNLGFAYDSSLPNCFADAEDGTNCSWPYSLAEGSPDAEAFARKLAEIDGGDRPALPKLEAHPGLWELPVTTLVVPPDDAAGKYRFRPGLRNRIAARGRLPYPSLYEPSSGRITGLDYTLLIDAGVSGDEMRAILEYNLDLHLAGNRSPLIFVAHAHLYAFSTPEDNPGTPTDAERKVRWKGLTDFIDYAMSKPQARIVAARDVLAFAQAAVRSKSGD